jgi:hypothetical protein
LPVETWNGFIAHRKAKRKPLTPHAAELVIRDLDKARGFGHDPVALIETAIASGWTGCVFEDKHFHSPPAAPVSHSPASALGREFDEILRGLNRPAIEGEVIREIH